MGETGLLLQCGYRHGPDSRRRNFRTAGSRRRVAAGARAVHRLGRIRREHDQQPRHRRHGQHVVQQRGTAGRRVFAGPDRVQQPDAPHQPRHLRAHYPGRCAQGGGHCGGGSVARGQSRRDDPAFHQGEDAARRWKRGSGTGRGILWVRLSHQIRWISQR